MNWQPEPYWQFWQRLVDPPLAPAPPSAWEVEKQMNRLARQVEKVESGRWLPRVAYKLSGSAQRELKEARALLAEAGQASDVLKGRS